MRSRWVSRPALANVRRCSRCWKRCVSRSPPSRTHHTRIPGRAESQTSPRHRRRRRGSAGPARPRLPSPRTRTTRSQSPRRFPNRTRKVDGQALSQPMSCPSFRRRPDSSSGTGEARVWRNCSSDCANSQGVSNRIGRIPRRQQHLQLPLMPLVPLIPLIPPTPLTPMPEGPAWPRESDGRGQGRFRRNARGSCKRPPPRRADWRSGWVARWSARA
jgi:hypothetical protein